MATERDSRFDPRLFTCVQKGNIYCYEHLGSYGQSAVSAKPRARQWLTPLNVWEPLSAADDAAWFVSFRQPLACEDCGRTRADLEGRN